MALCKLVSHSEAVQDGGGEDPVDFGGLEYQGMVFSSSVGINLAQGRERGLLHVIDVELALSEYSHPSGYHVLVEYSQ